MCSSGRLAIWTPVHFKPQKDHLEKLKVYRGASHICQWKSVSYHSAHTSMLHGSSGWCWSTLPCNLNSSPSIEERWVGQSSKWPENMTKNMKKRHVGVEIIHDFVPTTAKESIFHTSCNCRCELYQSQNKIMMNRMKGIFLKKRHTGVEINHDFCTQLQGIKYFKQLACKNWSWWFSGKMRTA